MTNIEQVLSDLKNISIPAHVRFELIEQYAETVTTSEDVLNFIALMESENNSILRHEISAQLLRINNKKPGLLQPIQSEIEDFLIGVILNDQSIVSRHEAIESLSSIGGKKSLAFLLKLCRNEQNNDILDTIHISLPLIEQRLEKYEK